jgi:phosphate transport system substrate-binding protein
MKNYLFFISLVIVLLLAGCSDIEDHGTPFSLDNLTTENYPKVDGSTSTEPLHALIACKLFGLGYSWVYIPFYFEYPYHLVPSANEKPEIAQFITNASDHTGTHTSYENLMNGNADLILVARKASGDELHMADSLGIQLIETPIALDALVFLVNEKNPVDNVSTQQIKDIYTGKITHWKDLSWIDTKINAYTREKNSGSQELMESLVMKDLEMLNFPDMMIYGMMGLINRLENDEFGFGYSVHFYTKYMIRSDNIKTVAVDNVYPDYANLKSRNYKYTAEVYAVVRKDLDENSMAYKLYQLLLTSSGQRVIDESGYISYY